MRKTLLIVVPAVVVAAALGIGLTRRLVKTETAGAGPAALTSGRGVALQWSDKPVAMPVVQLTDLEGRPVSNETLRGKVTLVNFWATWCGPCRDEIPMLVALQEYYKDYLTIVGASIDERPADEVKSFAAGFNVNYPIVMASGGLDEQFGGISAVPSTFVVNRDGKIVQRHLGILQARQTEHEVRALAGLATEASIETVTDTGQVLLSNAAYATTIPGVDLEGLSAEAKETVLKKLNTEHCTCGCNLTLAQCRINDSSCTVSLPIAQKIAEDARRTQK
jgi:thiol-disulfide isomerase/thioredoxin